MKTITIFHFKKNSLVKASLVIIFLFTVFFVESGSAQNEDLSPNFYLTSKSYTYKGWLLNNGKRVSLINNKYNEQEINKNYEIPNNYESIRYKLNNHDSFIKSINSVFTPEEILILAECEEFVGVGFSLDQEGQILLISFMIINESKISIDQIEELEKALLANITFTPLTTYDKKVQGYVYIRASFKEILAGEIPRLRKQENLK